MTDGSTPPSDGTPPQYDSAPPSPYTTANVNPPADEMQPPHRPHTGWIVAAVAGGLVLILLVVAAVTVHHHDPQQSTAGARTAATQYLTDLETGDYLAAYELLCPPDVAFVTEPTFSAAKAEFHPVSFSINTITAHISNNVDFDDVAYDETNSDGTTATAEVDVVRSPDGIWRPCHNGDDTWLVGH